MNQTIYFRKDIWDKFKDLDNKSEIVNKLLAVYFQKHKVTSVTQPKQGTDAQDELLRAANTSDGFNNIILPDDPLDTPPEYEQSDFSDYEVDPLTNRVFHKETGEQVPAKVQDSKIVELL